MDIRDASKFVIVPAIALLLVTIVFMMVYSRNMSRKEVRRSKTLHIASNVFYTLCGIIWFSPLIAWVGMKLLGV